jgi:hypothetical protein
MSYLFVMTTVLLTVTGKLSSSGKSAKPGNFRRDTRTIVFLWTLLLNPWVASSFGLAVIAALSWMVALTSCG